MEAATEPLQGQDQRLLVYNVPPLGVAGMPVAGV